MSVLAKIEAGLFLMVLNTGIKPTIKLNDNTNSILSITINGFMIKASFNILILVICFNM